MGSGHGLSLCHPPQPVSCFRFLQVACHADSWVHISHGPGVRCKTRKTADPGSRLFRAAEPG
jgi:hypothetical protein